MPTRVRTHWFFLIALPVVAIDVAVGRTQFAEAPRIVEAGLLFDLAVLLPLLYWLCYRSRGRKAAIRAVALACLGVWGAGKIVPEAGHYFLEYVSPLRYAGLGALVLVEVAVIVGIYRAVFKGEGKREVERKAQEQMDLPPWLAKLMVAEASFWKKSWGNVKSLFK